MAARKGNREARKPKQTKERKTDTGSISSLKPGSVLIGRKK